MIFLCRTHVYFKYLTIDSYAPNHQNRRYLPARTGRRRRKVLVIDTLTDVEIPCYVKGDYRVMRHVLAYHLPALTARSELRAVVEQSTIRKIEVELVFQQ